MPTSSPAHRLAFVDGVRALCALWVILYDIWRFNHQPEIWPLTPLMQSGHLGVEVFMVLSGFCLFYPMAKSDALEKGQWRTFFRRRARRILPPYYAAMIYAIALPFLLVPLFQVLGIPFYPPALPSAWQLFAHVTMIHNLFPDTQSGINPSFWSLSLESQFYALFPLMALAMLRTRVLGLCALVAACLLFRWGILSAFEWTPQSGAQMALSSIFGRMVIFAFGMLAAYVVRRAPLKRVPTAWDWLGGLAFVPLFMLGYYWYFHPIGAWPLSDACVGLAVASLLVRCASAPHFLTTWLSMPLLVAVGEMSYSFYLINRPTCYYVNVVLAHVLSGDDGLHLGATLVVGGLLSLGLASLLYRYVERPFMARRAPQAPLSIAL